MLSIEDSAGMKTAIASKVMEKRARGWLMNYIPFADEIAAKLRKDPTPPPSAEEKYPALAKAVDDAGLKAPSSGSDYAPYIMGIGGGILTNSILKALESEETEEERRKKTIWSKLLSALGGGVRLGLAGAAGYGMYRLGRNMVEGGKKK